MRHHPQDPLWGQLGDWVSRGRHRIDAFSGDFGETARLASRRARRRLRDGAEAFGAAEQSLSRTVKAHPVIFGIAGAGVACLLVAAFLWDRREELFGRR